MISERKTIGVLGGMGPEATLDFFAKLLARSPVEQDQDHLRLLIDNNPRVPNRNEAVAGTGPSPGPVLAEMARGLERSGADFLVMVCNTAHAFESDIVRAVQIPFVSLIEETVRVTLELRPKVKRIGLLAADGCLRANLYQDAFGARGVDVVYPEGDNRKQFMSLLYRIKRGDKGQDVALEMRRLVGDELARGAEVVVAGCTEVPLVLEQNDVPVPFVSSTDVLVEASIAYATLSRSLPERAHA